MEDNGTEYALVSCFYCFCVKSARNALRFGAKMV